MKASYSARAERDLEEIVDWIAIHRPRTALRIFNRIKKAIEKLADMPTLGSPCDHLPIPNLRSRTVAKRFVVYYRPDTMPIQVLRVVSGYRDAKTLDFD